jgi:hypothetical protein
MDVRHWTSWLALVLGGLLAVPGWADPDVDALRANNNALLQRARQDRALFVHDYRFPERPEAAAKLLLFCRQRGISTLFINVTDLPKPFGADNELGWRWRQLLHDAHQQNLTVIAMTGNVSYTYDTGAALEQVDRVGSFNQSSSPGEGFDGLLLDFPLLASLREFYQPPQVLATTTAAPPIEATRPVAGATGVTAPLPGRTQPAAAPGAEAGAADQPAGPSLPRRAAQPNDTVTPAVDPAALDPKLVGDEGVPEPVKIFPGEAGLPTDPSFQDASVLALHLQAAQKVRDYLRLNYRNQRLRLGITVPAWLQVSLTYRGRTEPFVDHLADLADFLVVHNLPGETTDIDAAAQNVMKYAGTQDKRVYLRIELTSPRFVTPVLQTLYNRDESFLENMVHDILGHDSDRPGFGGIALDDYHSYQRLPDRLHL